MITQAYAAAALCSFLAFASPAQAGGDARVTAYLTAAVERTPIVARRTLPRITDESRRLLALRAYLRAGDDLESRWSWTEKQIEAYAATPERARFIAEIERVRKIFESHNPGFTLVANTEVRSLDTQLERWNENPSVGLVAGRLYAAVAAELKAGRYPSAPAAEAVDKFEGFLRAWRPPSAAPLAAPGLSLHGQLRAVDFHVEKEGRLVASTTMSSVRSVWEKQGWGRKLEAAVRGSRFVGPLKAPNEPWHYEYVSQ